MYHPCEIEIPIEGHPHAGLLAVSGQTSSLVLFAHGSGSSRLSTRNNQVAGTLFEAGIGTLLFDLLTEREDRIYENRFDIALLSRRLLAATDWITSQPACRGFSIGYFGASTGAAAALNASIDSTHAIRAVVSRGGRPDLCDRLSLVRSPTLLIVGGNDDVVIELNRAAYAKIPGVKELRIVEGATHLFEEPGTLEQVAELAKHWFKQYL
jgi:putative phosphoribosyl transferase